MVSRRSKYNIYITFCRPHGLDIFLALNLFYDDDNSRHRHVLKFGHRLTTTICASPTRLCAVMINGVLMKSPEGTFNEFQPNVNVIKKNPAALLH